MTVQLQKNNLSSVAPSVFRHLMTDLSKAILFASSRISEDSVIKVVELVLGSKGKVLLIGVGKSGNIAQKIAATFASTGTSAVFLHPSEAFHGGLGIAETGDVAILFSGSGETREILDLIPHLTHRKIPLLAFVGKIESTLGRKATVAIDCGIEREICPYNLAPTTSTLVAMAVADCVAMMVMQIKGIKKEHFARNHPSGSLGKRLTLCVSDLMTSPPPTVTTETAFFDIVGKITEGGVGAVIVTSKNGDLEGIITDGDLRRLVQNTKLSTIKQVTASKFMTRNPMFAGPNMLAYDALGMMEYKTKPVNVLPVVNAEKGVIGIIRLHSIIQAGLN